MAPVFVSLVCLAMRLSLVTPMDSPPRVPETSLSDRFNRLEQLVLGQDLAIRQLEGEKTQWDIEKVQWEREREHWRKEREEWKTEREEWKREKEEWRRENEQRQKDTRLIAGLKAEWSEAKKQWDAERQGLTDAITFMKERLSDHAPRLSSARAEKGRAVSRSVHVLPRADDVNPLEPVVSQMAQRLTELSAEVQTVKSTHSADIQALRDMNVQQDQAIQEAGSSVYVRWGNSVCPNVASLVYSGVVGGSHYTHRGAASNHLCLSMSPNLSNHPVTPYPAYLFGAEYITSDVHDYKDAVCAVCRAPRPTVIVVPGTDRCQSGWTTEYSGFLMAGHYVDFGTEYICVDSSLGSRVAGDTSQGGNYLMFTLTQCGSLPCEPYTNNKVVTCAVCSK